MYFDSTVKIPAEKGKIMLFGILFTPKTSLLPSK